MNAEIKTVITILIATIWIGLSEFIRNQLILKSAWENHFNNLGLVFPSKPINGFIWMLWSLVFALIIFYISKEVSFKKSIIFSWLYGFVLMWLVLGNLLVLPINILFLAIPLSMFEVFVANLIIYKMQGKKIKL